MRSIVRVALCGFLVCATAAVAVAQTSTTTKQFQIISVEGNQLVVKLPEGTRELTVPSDFRFNIDGKSLSVQELKPGMSGTATITTTTTVTPVTVTEVKNGTVMQTMGTSIIVRTDEGMKMFSQADIDKRGIRIMREGKVAEISDFRVNDRLTATIITTKPPRVLTEREVQATLAKANPGAGAAPAASPAPGVQPRRPRAWRPRGLLQHRGNCPRPPAPCRSSGSSASRRSRWGWASLSGGVARRSRGFARRRRAAPVRNGRGRAPSFAPLMPQGA